MNLKDVSVSKLNFSENVQCINSINNFNITLSLWRESVTLYLLIINSVNFKDVSVSKQRMFSALIVLIIIVTQLTFTYSYSTIETLEKGVKYVQG